MKEVETMSKIAVVYWSGTGNTEAMANEVAEGAKAAGAEVDVLTASEFGADKMDAYDAVDARTAPSALHVSSHVLIHSPSPHP